MNHYMKLNQKIFDGMDFLEVGKSLGFELFQPAADKSLGSLVLQNGGIVLELFPDGTWDVDSAPNCS